MITLERCENPQQWLKFLSQSPQGTRYVLPQVLTSLGCKADHWLVYKNKQLCAGVTVVTENPLGFGLPMHSYYVGVMFHEEIWQAKHNRKTENELLITEGMMQALAQHYDRLELELHPSITDVRGFDWFNYHAPEKGRASICVRYTAQAKLTPYDVIRSQARGSRRREEKYACAREGLHFEIDNNPDQLVSLYEESLGRQDISVSETEKQLTGNLAKTLVDNEWGAIGVVKTQQNVAKAAGLLMFDYNGLCHLPVVGTSDSQYGGTMLYFGLMDYAAEKGYTELDFNGANSPQRAYFKHSIGGVANPYFCVSWSAGSE